MNTTLIRCGSLLALLSQLFLVSGEAFGLPGQGTIVSGHGSVTTNGAKMVITQTTNQMQIDWGSFNIKAGQTVNFVQPSPGSLAINLVTGSSASHILGNISANGIIWLLNPNGVYFGSSAVVSAGGFLAAALSSASQVSGTLFLNGTATQPVSNAGAIHTGKYAVLLGSSVQNTGSVSSAGNVLLLGGANATLTDLEQAGRVTFQLGQSTIENVVQNTGSVSSTSGAVILAGGSTDSLVASLVNENGTVSSMNGPVEILAGMRDGTVTIGSAANISGKTVTIDANSLTLDNTAPITGSLAIDPTYTYVGTASGLEALDTSQSTYMGSSNDILLTANINLGGYSWVPFGHSASPFDGTFNGQGFNISSYTIASGYNNNGFFGVIGSTGIVENTGFLGGYTLPIATSYGGAVAGQNLGTIQNVYSTSSVSLGTSASNPGTGSDAMVGGLVGYNTGSILNSYSTGNVTTYGSAYVAGGGVAGYSSGTLSGVYSTGTVSANLVINSTTATTAYAGGLVGDNYGSVSNSYATGAISANALAGTSSGTFSLYSGGAIGEVNGGTVSNVYSTGAATTSVPSTGSYSITTRSGGFAGSIVVGTVSSDFYDSSTNTIGAVASGSYTGITGLTTTQIDTDTTALSGAGWGLNTWGTNGFVSSASTDPWFFTTSGPVLVADMPLVLLNTAGFSKVYDGSSYGTTYTESVLMGSTLPSSSELSVASSVGPNAGTTNLSSLVTASFATPTSQSGNYAGYSANGTYTTTPGSFVISPAALTLSATKVYDGSTNLSGDVALGGLVGGQTLTYSGATANSANVGSGNYISAITLGNGTGLASNYQLPTLNATNAPVTINPAALTLSTGASKIYNGSATLPLSGSDSTLTGLVSSQMGGLYGTIDGVLASSGPGTNIGGTVSLTDASLTGNSAFLAALTAGDYTLPIRFTGGTVLANPIPPVYKSAITVSQTVGGIIDQRLMGVCDYACVVEQDVVQSQNSTGATPQTVSSGPSHGKLHPRRNFRHSRMHRITGHPYLHVIDRGLRTTPTY